MFKCVRHGWLLALWVVLAGCADGPPPNSRSESARAASAPEPERRSGLATGWGEARVSEVGTTSFKRASSRPQVATIRYSDAEGVDALLNELPSSARRVESRFSTVNNTGVSWRLSSPQPLQEYQADGERYVAGQRGARYEILVHNGSYATVEAVLSVDGLDALDGRRASTHKRGYIIAPGRDLRVEGFRTSASSVAAFRFTSVANSYVARIVGKTRNVGVVGLAVFWEKLDYPTRQRYAQPPPGSPEDEAERRQKARAF